MTKADQARALRIRLEEAFGDLSVPPDELIVYDNTGYHLECNQIRAKFRGRHWSELTIQDLAGEADSLSFFTPEAWRFFLPAFIDVTLTAPEQADRIPDAILASLARPDKARFQVLLEESRLERLRDLGVSERLLRDLMSTNSDPSDDDFISSRRESLTAQQKSVLKDFISFLRRHRAGEFFAGDLDNVDRALST